MLNLLKERHRHGRLFWMLQAAQVLSGIATSALQLTVAWTILRLQHSVAEAGLILAYSTAVQYYARPLLGGLGDHFDRATILVLAQFTSLVGALIVGLALAAPDPNWIMVMVALTIVSIAAALRNPLFAAMLTTVVEPDKMQAALESRSLTSSLTIILGAGVGGAALSTMGEGRAVLIATACFLASAVASLPLLGQTLRHPDAPNRYDWRSDFVSIFDLIKHVRCELVFSLLICAVDSAIYPYFTFGVPTLIQKSLHAQPWMVSLTDVGFAVGGMIGGLAFVPRVCATLGKQRCILIGLLFLGVGIAITGLGVNQLLFVSTFILLGIGLVMISIPISTIRSTATPNSHRTRMFAVTFFLSTFLIPVTYTVFTAFVARYGINNAVFIVSFAVFLTVPAFLAARSTREVLGLQTSQLQGFYLRRYPRAFRATGRA